MISAPVGIRKTLFLNGNTQDIVNSILYADKSDKTDVSGLAELLKGATVLETCNNIFNFIKQNIKYKIDPPGQQFIKSPAKLYHDRKGDCKSYSIFFASILKALKIPYKYRFAAYDDNKEFTHVYIIANNNIVCDAVMDVFNKEKPYEFKKDYKMTQISYLAGVDVKRSATIEAKGLPFSDIIELGQLLRATVQLPAPQGADLKIEITKEEMQAAMQAALNRINNSARVSGKLRDWIKAGINAVKDAVSIVDNFLRDNINLGLTDLILIGGGISSGNVWLILSGLGGNVKPLILGIKPNGNFIVLMPTNYYNAITTSNPTDETKELKNNIFIDLGNQAIIASMLIGNEMAIKKGVERKRIFDASLSKNSFVNTSRIAGVNYQVTDKFYDNICDILKQGYQEVNNPLSNDFWQWKNFRLSGGVGNIVEMMIYIANNLPLDNGKVLGEDYYNLFIKQVVERLTKYGYYGHRGNAALRLWAYMFHTSVGDAIKLPTPASEALTNTGTTQQSSGIDILLQQKNTDVYTLYQQLVKQGMSSDAAITYLIQKGFDVSGVVAKINQNASSKYPGSNITNNNSNTNYLPYVAAGALLLIKLM